MSYDITFIRKAGAQSWEEALEAHEARCPDDKALDAPTSEVARAEWNRIGVLLRDCHPALSRFEASHTLELTDEETGLQLSLHEDSAAITIPYWHSGEEAGRVMEVARALARIVEDETGLIGYDGQRDCRFLAPDVPQRDAAGMLSTMSQRIQDGGLLPTSNETKPPWWMFWKRR